MIYTIKNELLTAQVSSLGAELQSIKTNDGCEYLYQGNPEFWSGRAPIMFPICGRFFGGKYTYLGKEYEMGAHGFARHSEFKMTAASENAITLTLTDNEETKKSYPFAFKLDVTFSLKGKELFIDCKVTNTDEKTLIFALGGHPAFNVPLDEGLKFEDYKVEFDKECDAVKVELSPTCFCTFDDKIYTQGGTKTINLTHSLFDNDAIFLYNVPKKITLCSEKSARAVTVRYNKMKYVGLWHATGKPAPYVCIEPWNSVPSKDGEVDNLLTKREMIHLEPGYIHKTGFSIEIK